ncbi:MAG: homoserine kinase [Sulfitobacter sp.]
MISQTEEALALWGLEGAITDFVAGRENRVYRVRSNEGDYALRIKRPGYRSEKELLSELQWLDALDKAGLFVPRPKRALSGALLEKVGGHYADVVGWLDGRPIGKNHEPLDLENAPAVFRSLGENMARLHDAIDAWKPPNGFVRCHWDAEGLLGEAPLWGRFWENPTLDDGTRTLLKRFRKMAKSDLQSVTDSLDYGLIHADLVRENVLLDGGDMRFLDFDDGGYGYRIFEVATALLKNRSEPDFTQIKESLIDGYRSVRPLDTKTLDLFIALRAVTYVGWIVPRFEEEGAQLRNARFIADAQELCNEYLENNHS